MTNKQNQNMVEFVVIVKDYNFKHEVKYIVVMTWMLRLDLILFSKKKNVRVMFLLLVCCRVLLADFLTDVLVCLTVSSQPSLFFFDGEVEFPLKVSRFLPLLGQLLL